MVSIKTLLDLLCYGAALLGVAPLFPHLDAVAQLSVVLALVIGLASDRRGRHLLGPGSATAASLAVFIIYASRISREELVLPALNLLVLLLAVRLLAAKEGRHYLQIFVLAVFALAGSSLLSLSAAFLPYMIAMVLCVTVGLVLLTFFAYDPALSLPRPRAVRLFAVSLGLPLASLVLMLVFFVILPRTQDPLWNFLNPAATSTSGFAEAVAPGSAASQTASRKVALRVETDRLAPDELYWRAIVLNQREGESWIRQPPPATDRTVLRGGRPVEQTLYLEPQASRFLPVLDQPRTLSGIRASRSSDGVATAAQAPTRRVSYRAVSAVGAELAPSGPVADGFYLQLDRPPSPSLAAAAKAISAGGGSVKEQIERLEDFFRQQQLTYATTGLPVGDDPIAAFLFTEKRGHCEFFASSFAVLLRLSGIPARLVGGYYGGGYNDLGRYYLVTEEQAHVWVEALVEGRWRRYDPSRLAVNAEATILASSRHQVGTWQKLLDSADYYWNRLVIGYDLGRQFELLQAGRRNVKKLPGWRGDGRILLWLGGVLTLAAVVVRWWRGGGAARKSGCCGGFCAGCARSTILSRLPRRG